MLSWGLGAYEYHAHMMNSKILIHQLSVKRLTALDLSALILVMLNWRTNPRILISKNEDNRLSMWHFKIWSAIRVAIPLYLIPPQVHQLNYARIKLYYAHLFITNPSHRHYEHMIVQWDAEQIESRTRCSKQRTTWPDTVIWATRSLLKPVTCKFPWTGSVY